MISCTRSTHTIYSDTGIGLKENKADNDLWRRVCYIVNVLEGEWGQKGEGGCQTTKDRRCATSISAKRTPSE